MQVKLRGKKICDIDFNDIDSFEPIATGCRINLNNGDQLSVVNRYEKSTKDTPSIRAIIEKHTELRFPKPKKRHIKKGFVDDRIN